MTINYDKLLALKIPDAEHTYTDKDTNLDALGVADGGLGGPPRESQPVHSIPDRKPDLVCDLGTRPEQAVIYRLSGDRNPLHIDPDMAKTAGFPKPIMHGLGTFGVVGHAF